MKGARDKVGIIRKRGCAQWNKTCVVNASWSRVIPFRAELIFAFAQQCICARGRSPAAMPAYVCVCEGGGRNGKLNQRISRIYRRAIPGYCKCTVSVTSCRIFLGNPGGCLPAISLFLSGERTLRRPLREKKLSPGYYRSFDLVSRLPRNSPTICYRSLSRSTLNGRTRELSRSL